MEWKNRIPSNVHDYIIKNCREEELIGLGPRDYLENSSLLNLKEISLFSNNFREMSDFIGELSKEKFSDILDRLNENRRKVAHAKSTYSKMDLEDAIELITSLCNGPDSEDIILFLKNEGYKSAKEIPSDFFEEYLTPNNLPPENYDFDGGFVGREKEIRDLVKLIRANQDRVISITGAGGVGKTAVALRLAYRIMNDDSNPYVAILWYSAKTNKLTDRGIVDLDPQLKSYESLLRDISYFIQPEGFEKLSDGPFNADKYKEKIYEEFSKRRHLIIIDNLETVLHNDSIVNFIKDIPRPSQAILTSRKGLGEIERRYPIKSMLEPDAVKLFYVITKEKNRSDLARLSETTIKKLVSSVMYYPLLIKWSIGQVCLGRDIESAFSQIYSGESEIAKFSFNDIFNLISENSKIILFSMVVYGDKPISRPLLMHLSNIMGDDFDEAIEELVIASFVHPEIREGEFGIINDFTMLSLTRAFIDIKLDDFPSIRRNLNDRMYQLSKQIREFERSSSDLAQSLVSLGIETPEGQISFNYVKAAKNYIRQQDFAKAEEEFLKAFEIDPRSSYVHVSYSAYLFEKKHTDEALQYAKKATLLEKSNYFTFFNYGKMLRKTHSYLDAITALQKSKELNPDHLPTLTELGITLSLLGDYQIAENELLASIEGLKVPNPKHQLITLVMLGDNYSRWSNACKSRNDSNGRLEKILKAKQSYNKALEIQYDSEKNWRAYRISCIECGLAYFNLGKYDEGIEEILNGIKMENVNKRIFLPDVDIAFKGYYSLVEVSTNNNCATSELISEWLFKLYEYAPKGSHEFEMVEDLKKGLKGKGRREGYIIQVNQIKGFGIIKSEKEELFFFFTDIRGYSGSSTIDFEGRIVTYDIKPNPKKPGKFMAYNIEIMN
ncbi:MAG: NB-ARC domain-containing protein [Methanomassiliicoccales archaeon]